MQAVAWKVLDRGFRASFIRCSMMQERGIDGVPKSWQSQAKQVLRGTSFAQAEISNTSLGSDFLVRHFPTKIWRIRFLRSNYTHIYRHDVMHRRLIKFYTGFRLIVVSLDENVYARVGSRLKYFESCPRSRGRGDQQPTIKLISHITSSAQVYLIQAIEVRLD
jgi:hypothetical protein